MKVDIRYWMKRLKDLPFMSAILVTVNVIVFLICTFTGSLLYNMGSVGALDLANGEFYRLITSLFIHSDSSHLTGNMLILFGIGYMIETRVGHVRFVISYLFAGIGGNLLSAWIESVTGNFSSSVGASGAVFGLDGMLLALVLFSGERIRTVTLPRLIFAIGYSIYCGFTGENINNAAHVGGLLTGFVLTTFFCVINRIRKGQKNAVTEGLRNRDEH